MICLSSFDNKKIIHAHIFMNNVFLKNFEVLIDLVIVRPRRIPVET